MSITNLNTVSTPTTTTGVPTASAGTTTSSTAVSTTGTVGAPTSSSSTVTVTALMNKFEQGNMTVKDLVAELKYKGIASQVKTDDKFTSVTFKYSNKNYTIRSSNVNNESGTDSNKTTSYSDTTLRTTYKFSTEVINKYFDVCESYEDSAGKTTVTKYTIKENCGYSSPSALRTALYNEVKDQLILSTFLADKYDKNSTNSSLLTKVNSGKTNLSTTNYTTYADEIKKAAGDDVVKLKQDALNKVIKDFSCGNLVVQQLDTVLKSIGVENKTRTLTDGKYVVKFEFLGKNYQITCNQAAATKGGDTVHNKSYVFDSEFLSCMEPDDIDEFLYQIDEKSYRLKDELNISEFLEKAKLLGERDVQYLQIKGIDPEALNGYREMKDADGNIIAYGSSGDIIDLEGEENNKLHEMGIISAFDVDNIETPLLKDYFFTQVSENFYKLNPGITPEMIEYAFENNKKTIYSIFKHDLAETSPSLNATFNSVIETCANTSKENMAKLSNNKQYIPELLSQLNEGYNNVKNLSEVDADSFCTAAQRVVIASLSLCNSLEDFNNLYSMLDETITNKELLANCKQKFFEKAESTISQKVSNSTVKEAMNSSDGNTTMNVINSYANGEISTVEIELVLRRYADVNDLTTHANSCIETLIQNASDRTYFEEIVNDPLSNDLLSLSLTADENTTYTFNELTNSYKDLIENTGNDELVKEFKNFVANLNTIINEGKEDGASQAIKTLNDLAQDTIKNTYSNKIGSNKTEQSILKDLGLFDTINLYLKDIEASYLNEILSNETLNSDVTYEDAISSIMVKVENAIYKSPEFKFNKNADLSTDTQAMIKDAIETFINAKVPQDAKSISITEDDIYEAIYDLSPEISQKYEAIIDQYGLTVNEWIAKTKENLSAEGKVLTKSELVSHVMVTIQTLGADPNATEKSIQNINKMLECFANQIKDKSFSIPQLLSDCIDSVGAENMSMNDLTIAWTIFLSEFLGITDEKTVKDMSSDFGMALASIFEEVEKNTENSTAQARTVGNGPARAKSNTQENEKDWWDSVKETCSDIGHVIAKVQENLSNADPEEAREFLLDQVPQGYERFLPPSILLVKRVVDVEQYAKIECFLRGNSTKEWMFTSSAGFANDMADNTTWTGQITSWSCTGISTAVGCVTTPAGGCATSIALSAGVNGNAAKVNMARLEYYGELLLNENLSEEDRVIYLQEMIQAKNNLIDCGATFALDVILSGLGAKYVQMSGENAFGYIADALAWDIGTGFDCANVITTGYMKENVAQNTKQPSVKTHTSGASGTSGSSGSTGGGYARNSFYRSMTPAQRLFAGISKYWDEETQTICYFNHKLNTVVYSESSEFKHSKKMIDGKLWMVGDIPELTVMARDSAFQEYSKFERTIKGFESLGMNKNSIEGFKNYVGHYYNEQEEKHQKLLDLSSKIKWDEINFDLPTPEVKEYQDLEKEIKAINKYLDAFSDAIRATLAAGGEVNFEKPESSNDSKDASYSSGATVTFSLPGALKDDSDSMFNLDGSFKEFEDAFWEMNDLADDRTQAEKEKDREKGNAMLAAAFADWNNWKQEKLVKTDVLFEFTITIPGNNDSQTITDNNIC